MLYCLSSTFGTNLSGIDACVCVCVYAMWLDWHSLLMRYKIPGPHTANVVLLGCCCYCRPLEFSYQLKIHLSFSNNKISTRAFYWDGMNLQQYRRKLMSLQCWIFHCLIRKFLSTSKASLFSLSNVLLFSVLCFEHLSLDLFLGIHFFEQKYHLKIAVC